MAAHPIQSKTEGHGTIIVGGIVCTRMTRVELADQMVRDAVLARAGILRLPQIVVASNGYVIAKYHKEPEFRELIDTADVIDVDGMPSVIATKLLCKEPLKERVATTDFIHDACATAAKSGIRFYFLGAKEGVAAKAADNLRAMYPGVQIVGARDGYFSEQDEEALCAEIVASGADVLWVGLGSPLQEKFALRNRGRLGGVGWIRTCGGLFDFCAGRVPRAPQWMQNFALEWLFRVVQEPRRLAGRYMWTNSSALYHLLTKTRD